MVERMRSDGIVPEQDIIVNVSEYFVHTYCSNTAKITMYLKTRQYLMVNSDIGVTPITYILLGRVTADVRGDTRHLQTVNLVVSLSQILTSRLRGSLSEASCCANAMIEFAISFVFSRSLSSKYIASKSK